MIKRKKGKSPRAKLIRQLDDITRKIVVIRDCHKCQRCGKRPDPKGLHVHHVHGRSEFRLRWDLLNLISLCYGHHRYFHGHPHKFMEWFTEKYPHRNDYLDKVLACPPRTIRTVELEELLESHKEKLKELEDEIQGRG